MSNNPNLCLVDFYRDLLQNDSGDYMSDIELFTDDELECKHDYIQWLFPLPEKSAYQPDAPVLDDEVLDIFRNDDVIKTDLYSNANLMEDFYRQNDHWMTKNNHNYLRISRIIRCLALVGLNREATRFLSAIKNILNEKNNTDKVSDKTMMHWEVALTGKLPE